jgi:bifunctional non-homologous end joining protein LigD
VLFLLFSGMRRRFPRITEAMAGLRARTCIIGGEAVACGQDGIACFDLIRDWRNDERVFLRAFDLIELNGDDLRREPLICRKSTLAIVPPGAATVVCS